MKKLLKKLFFLLSFSFAPLAVFAAVPADVTTALDTAGTDGSTVAWAVFGALVVIAAVKYVRRSL